MRFRRKSADDAPAAPSQEAASLDVTETTEDVTTPPHPRDVAEVAGDGVERINLGALLVEPFEGRDLQLQVDEATGQVASVLFAGTDGALEFQAFAAPRNGSLWNEVRPDIVADLTSRGAEVTEIDGPWGAELHVSAQVQLPDGGVGVQHSRILGINGPRWMVRASFLGAPARGEADTEVWEQALAKIVVNRGEHALPVGSPLVVTLPDEARRTP